MSDPTFIPTPFSTPFAQKYIRRNGSCKLGQGGGCESVEEWIGIHNQKSFAVKKIPLETHLKYPYLYYNEVRALIVLQQSQVPRVVRLVEALHTETDCYLVLELVKGPTLHRYISAQNNLRYLGPEQEYEQSMLDLGAQLVQTMEGMHTAGVAHMDLTADNVMVHSATQVPSLKILDFGLSKEIATVKEASIDPMGANGLYAAPEVLDSMLSRFDPSSTGSMLVNGAAADVWSAGIVLFQALTSDVPFKARPYRLPPPPDHVTQEEMQAWEQHAGIRLSQQLWVDAVANAERMDSAVRHQLIEKLELTSSKPTIAVDFFLRVLHPDPDTRMTMAEAGLHPFMAPAMQRLLSRGAKLEAADQAGSTSALSPLSPSSACHSSTSHSVSMASSSGLLPGEAASASSLSSFSRGSTVHRLYLITQQLRLSLGLSLGLSLISNFLAGILRRCCSASNTMLTSAAVSKLTDRKISQHNPKCNGPRPACNQRLQADQPQDRVVCNGQQVSSGVSELATAADRPLARTMNSSSNGSSTMTSSSSTSDSEIGSTEANSSCNSPEFRGYSADRGQSSWLQRSVHSLAKHKKSLLAGAAAGFAVGAGLWMTR